MQTVEKLNAFSQQMGGSAEVEVVGLNFEDVKYRAYLVDTGPNNYPDMQLKAMIRKLDPEYI